MKFTHIVLLSALTACAPISEKPVVTQPVQKQATVRKPATVPEYMSAQESDIKEVLAGTPFTVERRKNFLIITLAGPKIFAPNSYRVEETAAAALKKIGTILADYEKTRISVFGYTENTSKASTNQLLSDKRADAVGQILEDSANIADVRFWVEGKGVAGSNSVEIILTPTFR